MQPTYPSRADAAEAHWFSRRHQTAKEHQETQAKRREHQERKLARAQVIQEDAAKAGPTKRLTILDDRLGPGVGAKKERARLERLAKC